RRRCASGLLVHLLRPEARVVQLFQDSLVDEYLLAKRKPLTVPWLRENHRIEWIRNDRDARIDNLLTDLVSSALLRERRAALVGRARIGIESDELDEIANSLRLENYRIATWLYRNWIARETCLVDRTLAHFVHVEL